VPGDFDRPAPKYLPVVHLIVRNLGDSAAMSKPGLIAAVLFVALLPIGALAAEPASTCHDAGIAAEREWKLPPDLIHAIGRVESGRFGSAWPWTVNANGSGSWFASRMEALAFVRALQSRGVRLIDVGCFQVDLFYHPAAFSSLEQAFDPAANADYAARFLTQLRGRTGSWAEAIAGYHSGRTLEGEDYRRKVMAQWKSGSAFTGVTSVSTGTVAVGQATTRDPFVVLMSTVARTIHVFGP
jgi:hypothetical protein